VIEIQQASPFVSEGFVIAQDPLPGARLRPGDTVFLTVSVGDKVRFPEVIGVPLSVAEQRLAAAGLLLDVVDEQGRNVLGALYDTLPPNYVVSALANGRPAENGQFVPRGSVVILGVRAP
jgi:serine/threonine-protein kinase